MWEVIKEPRIFQSHKGPMPIKAFGVKREDGFTLLREAQDDLPFFEKSGDETFSCRGNLGKCKFIAGRRGERGRQGSTYKVLLFWAEAADAEMCRAYAKDIESALLDMTPPLRQGVDRFVSEG